MKINTEFFLPKEHAETHVDCMYGDGGVRIYQNSPETVGLQIRTLGPTTMTRRGKVRPAYSHVSLNRSDLARIIEELQKQQLKLTPKG